MFYDSNKVNNILLCKQCEGRLDIPKNLPCGEAICSICETTIQVLYSQQKYHVVKHLMH